MAQSKLLPKGCVMSVHTKFMRALHALCALHAFCALLALHALHCKKLALNVLSQAKKQSTACIAYIACNARRNFVLTLVAQPFGSNLL